MELMGQGLVLMIAGMGIVYAFLYVLIFVSDWSSRFVSRFEAILLEVAPKNYNAPYLQLMASLSRILHVSSAYRRLLMCTSAESMKDFFSSK